ncbi:MAG: type IV secretory system conjugative DNA transfer family protein [Holdemanella sp.]|nr:type IV secretory system conjugative DNA transfer family protein [Holdemanella sp.]
MKSNESGGFLRNEYSSVVIFLLILLPVIFALVSVLFWMVDLLIVNANQPFFSSVVSHSIESLVISVSIYGLCFYLLSQNLFFGKPKERNQVASQGWVPVHSKKADGKSQEKFFASAPIDTDVKLDVGGAPVNKIGDRILYEVQPVHDLCVGTTRSGKSRKVVRQLVMIASMAEETMFFNDPKKEMYQDFHKYLEKKGYDVYCLDFRNPQYSNMWNPLSDISYMYSIGMNDEADQYASDQVASLVVDNGKTEAIWIDGQKALIKALIEEVCSAPISEERKNYFSVYQMMSILQQTVVMDNKKEKMLLSIYMESLKETAPSRIAYTPILVSPEKTRGSFMTSAIATLSPFTGQMLMKVLSRSEFDLHDFTKGKKAVFVVNPDEKNTYDGITAMFFDQVYQSLVFEANKLSGRSLEKRVHMILDEFGNMPIINELQSKITVALSRKIIYHLYLQDFKQMNNIYGQDVATIIRSNCNLSYFISSADFDTCEEMSKKFGEHDVWVDSMSGSYDSRSNPSGNSVSYAIHQRRLIDANELLNHNGAETGEIFVHRTYLGPCRVNLPDCSSYDWYNEMEHDETEKENEKLALSYAVPRYVLISEMEKKAAAGDMEAKKAVEADRAIRSNPRASKVMATGLNQNDFYWYWSESDNLGDVVKSNVLDAIEKSGNPNFDIKQYIRSKPFVDMIWKHDLNKSWDNTPAKLTEAMTGEDISRKKGTAPFVNNKWHAQFRMG